jgi:hypothetical protein
MWQETVNKFIYEILNMKKGERLTEALNFFIYDTVKIFFLLLLIIFVVTLLRTYFNTDKVRVFLSGKNEFTGNILAALFGIITPFCSCSAIPLFLGFLQARIPIGVTFSFLISAPMNNEIAIGMLYVLFGWKVTLIYIGFGLLVAIIGGILIGKFVDPEKYVLLKVEPINDIQHFDDEKTTFKEKLSESWEYTFDIFKKIYLYIIVGVAVGGFIHGYIPIEFITNYAGKDNPFSVIFAVILGIPMYSNAAGIMPLIEVLTQKGMELGTALSFMMAVTALSLPEAMILKRVMHIKLILIFFGIVGLGIISVGYLFNFLI